MATDIVKVQFDGDSLEGVQREGRVWVVVKRVCDALGVDDEDQRKKLRCCGWATPTVMTALAADGKTRAVTCIDLDQLPMWLATISASRVRPELREKLIRYQRECARVLRDHFLGRPQVPSFDIRHVVELVAQTIVPAIMAAVDARLASAQATSISRADHQWFRRKLTELAEAEFSLGRHPRKHTVGAVRLALLSELGRCRDVDWESRPWQMLPPAKFAPARVWIDARLRAVQRDVAQHGQDNQRQLAFRAN